MYYTGVLRSKSLGSELVTSLELVAAADAGRLGGSSSDGNAAVNAASFAQLLLDMHRYAGVMLLDKTAAAEVYKLTLHLEQAAQVRGRGAGQHAGGVLQGVL